MELEKSPRVQGDTSLGAVADAVGETSPAASSDGVSPAAAVDEPLEWSRSEGELPSEVRQRILAEWDTSNQREERWRYYRTIVWLMGYSSRIGGRVTLL